MFNVTFSFALADVPFHFIPKIFWEHEKNVRRLTVMWLTGCIVVDNDRTARVGKDIYYQAALTAILDSYTKSSEIVDIMNENKGFEVWFDHVMDYLEKNHLLNEEKDENGFHIICDTPGMSFWEENKVRNKITQKLIEDEEMEKRNKQKEDGHNDSSSKFYFTE